LLDGQKNKASDRLTRVIRSVVHGGSVASLVWRRTESGRPHTPVRAALIWRQSSPVWLAILT
jgi:hypothetical protein